MNAISKRLTLILLLGGVSIGSVLLLVYFSGDGLPSTDPRNPISGPVVDLTAQFERLEAREREADQQLWAPELLAEDCGRSIESLWDSINASTNKLDVLAGFPVGEVVLGDWSLVEDLGHGIRMRKPTRTGAVLSAKAWRDFVVQFARTGWKLEQVEFRHEQFDTNAVGQPGHSRFYFSGHLANTAQGERAILVGDLGVDWADRRSGQEPPGVGRVDASRLVLKTRRGEAPFVALLSEQITPPEKTSRIDPLIVYDLDGDGLSEIILASKNVVYRRNSEGHYVPEPFCRYPIEPIQTGLVADFDGDGSADFLCAGFRGLYLFKGSSQGTFDSPPRLVWEARPQLRDAQVLTCGDIDLDGDLDVFLGQYKSPYDHGQMPTPYFDANDGDPASLLLNDGRGNFSDATAASGLAPRRHRRSYSGSLVDLTGDGFPDLVVVSDFTGLDLYRNDGRGHFDDVTADWVSDPKAFGMSHTLADFNGDGLLDLLMIGMNSPTVRRLDHLNLWRPDGSGDMRMRGRVSAGNRLYLAAPGGGFESPPTLLADSIARSGWSWGSSAFDFDNDGFPDVYVANGHETGSSVRDYEREFWMHDIHVGCSTNDIVAGTYFQAKSTRTRGRGESYGGYEKNRLFLNRTGEAFVEVGYLAGVAFEEDSRSVVTDDLDGDGKIDLLLTTYESWPVPRQMLRVYKNTLATCGNWIGFRFREDGLGKSPVGAKVTIHCNGHVQVQQIVTGDSYRSQHSNTVHFGLGRAEQVDRVDVQWPGGEILSIPNPLINRYHRIVAPRQPVSRE